MAHVRVRITRPGFIGNQLRRPGDEITLADERYVSKTWMEVIPLPKPTQEPPAPAAEPDSDASKPKRK
jgi:hypothetical protein